MILLLGALLLSVLDIAPIVNKGYGKSAEVSNIDEFAELLSCIQEKTNITSSSIEGEHQYQLLSLTDNNIYKKATLNKNSLATDNANYYSWTVDLSNLYGEEKTESFSVIITGDMHMAITENSRYFHIENATLTLNSEALYFHIEYDAEVYISNDIFVIKYNKYDGADYFGVEISRDFLGKWFHVHSFDSNAWKNDVIEIYTEYINEYFSTLGEIIDDAINNNELIIKRNKYVIKPNEDDNQVEILLDLTAKDQPTADIFLQSNNYLENYSITITNINNTTIDFSKDVEIHSNPNIYFKELNQ